MKKRAKAILLILLLIIIVSALLVLSILIRKYTPTKETMDLTDYYDLSTDAEVPIILNQQILETGGSYVNGTLYLPSDLVHDSLDQRFFVDANEGLLLYTTETTLYSADLNSSSYYENNENPQDLGAPVMIQNGQSFLISADFVFLFLDCSHELYQNPDRLVLVNDTSDLLHASCSKKTEIRRKGGIKSPILETIDSGTRLVVLEQDETWTKVADITGVIGYVKSSLLESFEESADFTPSAQASSPDLLDEQICLAWHQVTSYASNSNLSGLLSSEKGINVISPTWFYLDSSEGDIHNLGSSDYVASCHQKGIQVWALVSNLENSSVDSTYMLTHTSSRRNFENQMIAAAKNLGLDGINLDFEALSSDVGDGYIQLVRELSIKCAESGLILSVDNYVPSSYTSFYNLSEQACFADYIIIMGYDEHYAGSEEGSVASYTWVRDGVLNTLDQVPAEQTILGMPFYTRVWALTPTDQTSSDSGYTVSSEVYGMSSARSLAESNGASIEWQEDYGQDLASWTADGINYLCWLENENSFTKRLDLVIDQDLAGAAFWKLGMEADYIWDTISSYY